MIIYRVGTAANSNNKWWNFDLFVNVCSNSYLLSTCVQVSNIYTFNVADVDEHSITTYQLFSDWFEIWNVSRCWFIYLG